LVEAAAAAAAIQGRFFDWFSDFWEPQFQVKLGSFEFVREPLLKGPHIPNPTSLVTRRFFLFQTENRTALVVVHCKFIPFPKHEKWKKKIIFFFLGGGGGGGGE